MVAKLENEDEDCDSASERLMYKWHDVIKAETGTSRRFYDIVEEITGARSTENLEETQIDKIIEACNDEFGESTDG